MTQRRSQAQRRRNARENQRSKAIHILGVSTNEPRVTDLTFPSIKGVRSGIAAKLSANI
jgi:hypothetical protein